MSVKIGPQNLPPTTGAPGAARVLLAGFGWIVLFLVLIFAPARTLDWPAAWVFLVLFLGHCGRIVIWLWRHNPGLLRERLNLATRDQNWLDRGILAVAGVFYFGVFVTASRDVFELHVGTMPLWLQVVGGALIWIAMELIFWVFRTNSFLSPVVRIQSERAHQLVTHGPYAYVRHPLYGAVFPLQIGTSLLVGSWLSLLPGLALVATLAVRAIFEEQTVRRAFVGYDAYCTRVRWRLLPWIW
jgi:protein-S-isoprenylcysteine O-methyltransferase Ste14